MFAEIGAINICFWGSLLGQVDHINHSTLTFTFPQSFGLLTDVYPWPEGPSPPALCLWYFSVISE